MKKLYRFISCLLLLAMMLNVFGAGAFADESGTEAETTAAPAAAEAAPVAQSAPAEVLSEPVPSVETSGTAEMTPSEEADDSIAADAATTPAASGVSQNSEVPAVEEIVDEDEVSADELQATKRYYHIDVLTQGTYTYNFTYSGDFVSTADINITKEWDDAEDNDGIRPDSVQVNLYQNDQNGSSVLYKTVTLTAAGGWTYALSNAPAVDANGKEITYTAKEVNVPDGYESKVSVTKNADDSVSGNYATYQKNGNTIVFGFADKAPYISVNGSQLSFTGSTATVAGGVWTYDSANRQYSFVGTETMVVDKLNYITYTDYQNQTKTLSGSLYSSQWDSGHQNQEFFLSSSYRTSLYLTPDSTIVVNYTYGYSYVDEFGITHTFSNITTSQTFDNPETDNVCSKKNYSDSQAGYDVRLYNTHQTSDTFIENQGTEYNFTVTNSHEIETVDVKVVKKWVHTGNTEKYPESVVFHIANNDGHLGTSYKKTVTAEDNWTAEWTGLPKKVNGVLQNYVVWEEKITNYTGSYSGYTDSDGKIVYEITNTFSPEYTTVSAQKHWVDNDDQDGIRPDSVTLTLQQSIDNGASWTKVEDVELYGNSNWEYVWTKLPTKTADDEPEDIVYRVVELTENVPEGYKLLSVETDSDVSGLWHITNEHVPETTKITVNKEWKMPDGSDVYESVIPSSAEISLLANGTSVSGSISLNSDNKWTYTFENLPVYAKGEKIVYEVVEQDITGYTSSVSDIKDGVITVTNTMKTVSITGNKVWLDKEGKEQGWPQQGVDALTFYLHADGKNLYDYYKDTDPVRAAKYVQTLTKTQWEEGTTSVTWSDLTSVYNGASITYTIWEGAVEDYSVYYTLVSQDTDGNRVVKITNQFDPDHTEVTVSKIWDDNDDQDGIRPEVLTVMLYAEVGDTRELVDTAYLAQTAGDYVVNNETVTVTTGSWVHIWTELDIRDENGNEIEYTVEEMVIDGYESDYVNTEGQWSITNTHKPDTVELTVKKEWETFGNVLTLPDVELSLLADGVVVQTVTVGASEEWKHTFTELPKYKYADGKGGNLIKYEIKETPVVGYDAPEYTVNADGSITVLNTLDTVYLIVRKIWDDENNYDGLRPGEIEVKLLADGEVVETVKIGSGNNWWHRFTDLPKYDGDGNIINYTVEETPVANYEAPEYGYNTAGTYVAITNTHVPLTTTVSVTKEWDDETDRDQARPESIMVRLYRDGQAYGLAPYNEPVELSADNDWSYEFTDLYRYDGYGEPYVYEIREYDIDNYEQSGYVSTAARDYSSYDITITNTYIPDKEITVTKKWDDNDNQDGIRPEAVTVHLLADGVKVGTEKLSDDNDWTVTFSGLYTMNADGDEIIYTVEEDPVDGYEAKVTGDADEGFVVRNVHVPETAEITVNKVWVDNNNKEGKRPESITVQLYANGEKYGDAVTIKADKDGDWSYTYEALPVYENGEAITYTVKEAGVKYYVTKYSDIEDGVITIQNTFVDIPLTGDTMNLIFWSVLVIGAAGALAAVGAVSIRKRRLSK